MDETNAWRRYLIEQKAGVFFDRLYTLISCYTSGDLLLQVDLHRSSQTAVDSWLGRKAEPPHPSAYSVRTPLSSPVRRSANLRNSIFGSICHDGHHSEVDVVFQVPRTLHRLVRAVYPEWK